MKLLISACLMGVNCRYDGTGKVHEALEQLMKTHELIPICPEQLGGLPTPRKPVERVGDRVLTADGEDFTKQFERGANEVLALANLYQCDTVILKEKSPSCGYGTIYDGSFSGTLTAGDGVTAELLLQHGIRVIGESQLDELLND